MARNRGSGSQGLAHSGMAGWGRRPRLTRVVFTVPDLRLPSHAQPTQGFREHTLPLCLSLVVVENKKV